MSQSLQYHRIKKITRGSIRTLTTDDGKKFSTAFLTIYSLDLLGEPTKTQIDLFADQPEALRIETEEDAQ